MSQFESLDLHLRQDKALLEEAESAVLRNIDRARTELDPLVEGSFNVIYDYYATILKPRTDLRQVEKKREHGQAIPKI